MSYINIANAMPGSLSRDAVRQGVAAGGAAEAALTVTGINLGDRLVSVLRMVGAGTDVTDVTNLTAEFAITAANTIANVSGDTDTTGSKLIVTWLSVN